MAKKAPLTDADRAMIERIVLERLLCGEEPSWAEMRGVTVDRKRPCFDRVYAREEEIIATVEASCRYIERLVESIE